jgi:type IV pilus assembly protein PilW
MRSLSSQKRLSGFTLIELMVGMTLSLLLTIAIVSILIQSRTSYKYQEALAAARSDGAAAITILEQELRIAGYPKGDLGMQTGIAGTGGAAGAPTYSALSPPTIAWGGGTSDNSIIIQYKAPTAGHKNCAGETFNEGDIISERLSVGVDDAGRSGLLCEGQAEKIVLIEKIIDLSFTFGEDTDGDGVPNGYEKIGDGKINDLSRIVSVTAAVTVDVDYADLPDHTYSTAVPLRNQIP